MRLLTPSCPSWSRAHPREIFDPLENRVNGLNVGNREMRSGLKGTFRLNVRGVGVLLSEGRLPTLRTTLRALSTMVEVPAEG